MCYNELSATSSKKWRLHSKNNGHFLWKNYATFHFMGPWWSKIDEVGFYVIFRIFCSQIQPQANKRTKFDVLEKFCSSNWCAHTPAVYALSLYLPLPVSQDPARTWEIPSPLPISPSLHLHRRVLTSDWNLPRMHWAQCVLQTLHWVPHKYRFHWRMASTQSFDMGDSLPKV